MFLPHTLVWRPSVALQILGGWRTALKKVKINVKIKFKRKEDENKEEKKKSKNRYQN